MLFFFQAEDGIRDFHVTGVQTCALPISAAALGVPTVAVHPEDDAACAHRVRADEAVQLPGTGAAAYLDVAQIVAAAVRTGCDALHPGYGFLAENPALAPACAEHGIPFLGPSPD